MHMPPPLAIDYQRQPLLFIVSQSFGIIGFYVHGATSRRRDQIKRHSNRALIVAALLIDRSSQTLILREGTENGELG